MNSKNVLIVAALLCGMAAFGAVAQAQVAAPMLNNAPMNLQPFNPAVLPWDMGNTVGVAVLPKLKAEAELPPFPVVEIGTGKVTDVFLRAAGQSFAFTAERLVIDFDDTAGTVTHQETKTGLAVAAKIGASFTVSAGLRKDETTDTDTTIPVTKTDRRSGAQVGGTWRISDAFYLGGSYAMPKVEWSDGVNTAAGDRKVSTVGAGFYSHNGDSGFHAEVYKQAQGVLEVTDPAGNYLAAEQGDVTGVTLEGLAGNFLFGLSQVKNTTETNNAGSPVVDTRESTDRFLTVGYAPDQGLSLSFSKFGSEETDTAQPGATTTFSGIVVGLAFSF